MYKRKSRLNFTLRITRNDQVVERYETRSKKLFYNKVRSIKWQHGHPVVYIRVGYGRLLSNRNRLEPFWNDGNYDNKKDLMLSLNAFTEN